MEQNNEDIHPKKLFKGCKIHLNPAIPDTLKDKLKRLLKENGAAPDNYYTPGLTTHIISQDITFAHYDDAKAEGVDIVSPEWVIRSVENRCLQPCSKYSADPAMFFSGLVICTSQVPVCERDAIWATVQFFGGQFKSVLDSKCTHLVALKPEGAKFEFAKPRRISIVKPSWVQDCISQKKKVSEKEYLLAPIIEADEDEPAEDLVACSQGQTVESPTTWPPVDESTREEKDGEKDRHHRDLSRHHHKKHHHEDPKAHLNFDNLEAASLEVPGGLHCSPSVDDLTAIVKDAAQPSLVSRASSWAGETLSFLQGTTFVVTNYMPDYTKQITTELGELGATVLKEYSPHVTHLLTQYREGPEYESAVNDNKVIVTALWLHDCLVAGKLVPPDTKLLYSPLPNKAIPDMSKLRISISGFSGSQRDDIKDLVQATGAECTGHMTPANTHLICKSAVGDKYKKALEWHIKVVNEKWIEDVVRQWKKLPEEDYKELQAAPVGHQSSQSSQEEPKTRSTRAHPEVPRFTVEVHKSDEEKTHKKKKRKSEETATTVTVASSSSTINTESAPTAADTESKVEKLNKKKKAKVQETDTKPIVYEDKAQQPSTTNTSKSEKKKEVLQPINAAPGTTITTTTTTNTTKKSAKGNTGPRKCFLLSGTTSERESLKKIIKKLGGEVSSVDLHAYDPQCTHLIMSAVKRTEKLLCAHAQGKWVLSQKYLEDSNAAGHFLDETPYEWYGEGWNKDNNVWMGSSRKWRLNYENTHQYALQDKKVIIYGETEPPHKMLASLIRAAGGIIVNMSPPYHDLSNIEFALVGQKKANDAWITKFHEAGIKCVRGDYILAYLSQQDTPDMLAYDPFKKEHGKASSTASPQKKGASKKRSHVSVAV